MAEHVAVRPTSTNPILVVDDDPSIRQTLIWALEDEGFSVESVADGRQALQYLEQHRPTLMLLDMGLPYVDGARVADGARAVYGASMPIVVLSADGRAMEKGLSLGAVAALRKPFELDELLEVVHHAMECPG